MPSRFTAHALGRMIEWIMARVRGISYTTCRCANAAALGMLLGTTDP
jgi:hypothetical protein